MKIIFKFLIAYGFHENKNRYFFFRYCSEIKLTFGELFFNYKYISVVRLCCWAVYLHRGFHYYYIYCSNTFVSPLDHTRYDVGT